MHVFAATHPYGIVDVQSLAESGELVVQKQSQTKLAYKLGFLLFISRSTSS